MKKKPEQTNTTDKSRDKVLLEIAKTHLFLETLERRNSDSLDFHDCSVGLLRRALNAAYEAGRMRERNGK